MQRINVLSIHRTSAEDRAKIEAVDPAIQLTDAGGRYDGEIRETWPHGAVNLFCDNLRAYLDGGPLRNVIDWARGY
jgi:hypothetical protein